MLLAGFRQFMQQIELAENRGADTEPYRACIADTSRPRMGWAGSGGLGNSLIRGITGVTIWIIGVINLLTKPS